MLARSRGWHRFGMVDVGIMLSVLLVVAGALGLGRSLASPLGPALDVDLAPRMLPYYAGLSLLRMFMAFTLSMVFTIVYAKAAAGSRVAETVLLPLLDVLQSIPVLGFLSVTVTVFMNALPGSRLGLEMASILAIFTSQVWNLTFSFYQSLVTVPQDLHESTRVFQLNGWKRFWTLELPHAAIPLVWNGMMSFGGGWFFLAASEAITVLNQDIRLPGLGSYLAVAVDRGDARGVIYCMAFMAALIVALDQVLWRPLVAWTQRFRQEQSGSSTEIGSWVLQIIQRSAFAQSLGCVIAHALLGGGESLFSWLSTALTVIRRVRPAGKDLLLGLFRAGFMVLSAAVLLRWLRSAAAGEVAVLQSVTLGSLARALYLGLLTFVRVSLALLAGAAWCVPVGVAVGLNRSLAERVQPWVQVVAAFPANMLFPLVTAACARYGVPFDVAAVLLMMLGTQWYILFNVIAGAMAIPDDLLEASDLFRLRGVDRWRRVVGPAIFPSLVVAGMTASGGAWNASIVAELASWGARRFRVHGIGAMIAEATSSGDWAGIATGIGVMCVMVVTINRLVWRRLHEMAETRFHV